MIRIKIRTEKPQSMNGVRQQAAVIVIMAVHGQNWPVDVKINGLTVAELPSVEAEEVDQPNDEPQKDESSDTKITGNQADHNLTSFWRSLKLMFIMAAVTYTVISGRSI